MLDVLAGVGQCSEHAIDQPSTTVMAFDLGSAIRHGGTSSFQSSYSGQRPDRRETAGYRLAPAG
jgi:hypothetical protein